MLISPTWNPKQLNVFLLMLSDVTFSIETFFPHKHDINNTIYMIIHMKKTFKAMQCQNCRKYFKKK